MSAPATLGTQRVAIVGLGLMGGSIARDLASRGVRVLGYDRDPLVVESALSAGVVHGRIDEDAVSEGVDVVVLAVPVTAAADAMSRFAALCRTARLVTDVGSTKVGVAALAERAGLGSRFVGGHPLAGDHRSGWQASRAGRFAGARVFLCPSREASSAAIELAEGLWQLLGARTERIAATEHDALLAWSSHLPQFVSCALAAALYEAGIARSELGPGGRDATRLAGSSPDVWTAVATENASLLTAALRSLEARVRAIRSAIETSDAESVRSHLEIAHEWFDAAPPGTGPARHTRLS